jgi:hypothetical protein
MSLPAAETRIDVRVISKGAKFIGTSMGGVEITIKDAATGELLDRGVTAGTTGDTEKIMEAHAKHHAPVSTPDAAVFRAAVDLAEPRRLEIAARGPLAQPQAINTVTTTQWVVPGKHLTGGDAMTLEMPGFVVDILSPPAHRKLTIADQPIALRANVTMMCGCPVEPGGLWDADQFEVVAIIKRNGEAVQELPLNYAGSTSQFTAPLKLDKTGSYEAIVYAYDPENGNTGVDKTTWLLREPQ